MSVEEMARAAFAVIAEAVGGSQPFYGCAHLFEDVSGTLPLLVCLDHPALGVRCPECMGEHADERHHDLSLYDLGDAVPWQVPALFVQHASKGGALQVRGPSVLRIVGVVGKDD